MQDFNMKQWLMENKSGMFSKTLNEINPAALGAPQAAADAEMQQQDDENGDIVDNASMGVVAEGNSKSTTVNIEEWEVTILGKDHIIDAEVDVDFHGEEADYEDNMMTSPGGVYIDSAFATITKLGVEDGDAYRDVNDPAYIKQIEDLINKDPKLNRKLEDEVGRSSDFEAAISETVGYAMITKPSDPNRREPLEM